MLYCANRVLKGSTPKVVYTDLLKTAELSRVIILNALFIVLFSLLAVVLSQLLQIGRQYNNLGLTKALYIRRRALALVKFSARHIAPNIQLTFFTIVFPCAAHDRFSAN